MTAVRVVLALGLAGTAFADEPAPTTGPDPGQPVPQPAPAQEPVPTPAPMPPMPAEIDDERAVPERQRRRREIRIETPGERSRDNKLMLGGLAGAAALAGGIGLYFHLDSRDAVDQVSANIPTGKPWTPARADLVERAESSRTNAIVAYSIGGAILTGAIVAFIVTEPASETSVIRTTSIVPARGGAVVTTGWSF
jgi:hypothetical protein